MGVEQKLQTCIVPFKSFVIFITKQERKSAAAWRHSSGILFRDLAIVFVVSLLAFLGFSVINVI